MVTPLILIVDDIEANRDTLRELLEPYEYQLVEASDGATALKIAAQTPPDLVLLDVMMPGMDGFEVCRRLRADSELAEIPVVLVTALDDHSSRLAGIEAGADDFVTKPINRAELRARVRTITRLNRYRRIQEQHKQFQWVIEHAGDGYILINPSDEIVFANACARQWLGLAPERSTSPQETFLKTVQRSFTCEPATHWDGWPKATSETADTAEPVRLLVRSETADARAFFLEMSVHQNSGGYLLRLRDVTDRLTVRRNQRSFQAMLGHKLRTPLNGLCGSLDLLTQLPGLSQAETAEYIGVAQEGARRLLHAVNDVLEFAELAEGKLGEEAFMLVDLAPLIERVRLDLGLDSVALHFDSALQDASIPCTADALEWVLYELLENSKKFHPNKTPGVMIEASLHGKAHIRLMISDNGRAVPPEHLARAGMPFFQGERDFTGQMPGMGLGLASVFTLVWQTGGSCSITNQAAGPGVCVELKWPLPVPQTDNAGVSSALLDAFQPTNARDPYQS